jgi:hypothetical protein
MPVSLPVIDLLLHPPIGLLNRVAFPFNPYPGPFIAEAPPTGIGFASYGVVLRIDAVGPGHGRDASFPEQFDPKLGKCAVHYNDLSGLDVVRDVMDWTYDNQPYFWTDPFPALFTLFLAPDVSVNLFWFQS